MNNENRHSTLETAFTCLRTTDRAGTAIPQKKNDFGSGSTAKYKYVMTVHPCKKNLGFYLGKNLTLDPE